MLSQLSKIPAPSTSVNLSEGYAAPSTPMNARYRPLPHPAQSTAPLVIVEGFLSYTSEYFWGDFETHLNAHRAQSGSQKRRSIIFARVSPVNSVHDRACELFYNLRGGTVDYGQEHAKKHGHKQYGRHHSVGLYPSWSAEYPLHFLGHSMGGVTVVKMVTLIREGFFGPGAHPDMVVSLTSVGSPFRGTQLSYWVTGTNQSGGSHHPISFASFLSKYLHTITYFSPILPSVMIPDFFSETRSLSMKDISPFQFLKQLWKSDWSEGRDAIPWDCTFEASEERDEEWERSIALQGSRSRTWFRSYVSNFTRRVDPSGPFHMPHLRSITSSVLLWMTGFVTGGFDLSNIRPIPLFLRPPPPSISDSETEYNSSEEDSDAGTLVAESYFSTLTITAKDLDKEIEPEVILKPHELGEHYYSNDGVVPLFSMWHPGPCSSENCTHYAPLVDTARLPVNHLHAQSVPRPGIWNVVTVRDAHHLSLMPLWMGSKQQQTFWYGLGEWLEQVDHARGFFDIMEARKDGRMGRTGEGNGRRFRSQ